MVGEMVVVLAYLMAVVKGVEMVGWTVRCWVELLA
jgi:hypothetical protein